jgi:hypothetical protein
MCINYYHPIVSRGLHAVAKPEFLRAQKIGERYFPQPEHCYMKGCIGGLVGLSVGADGEYWNCSRAQRVIGRYPQMIGEVLDWEKIRKVEHNSPEKECMRFVREDVGRCQMIQ